MTMLPEWWTVPYPEVSSVETAAAYLDTLGGALNRTQENGAWVLSTGQQELARGGSPAELDSFVLGFALAHLICERHGPIARRPPEAAGPAAGAPVTTAPAAVETADAPAETAPPEPEAATAAALASADAVPGDAGGERASLTVVRQSEPESGSATEEVTTDEADRDEADADGAGEDSDETVGQGSGGGGRRRRRRR